MLSLDVLGQLAVQLLIAFNNEPAEERQYFYDWLKKVHDEIEARKAQQHPQAAS